MLEGHARGGREALGARRQVYLERVVVGGARRVLLEQEAHALHEPAAHDDVAAVEPERQRLAVEQLVLDPRIDQRRFFRGGRRTSGAAVVVRAQPGAQLLAHDDAVAGREQPVVRLPRDQACDQQAAGEARERRRAAHAGTSADTRACA
ncbi:MAG: hypothetical protein FJ148_26750 [Deltaproteobacteria bacterium]|nr:hypothetical protein [Deltaproteobacteria bacterium]